MEYRYVLVNNDSTKREALDIFLSGFGIVYHTKTEAKYNALKYGLKIYQIKIGVNICAK